MEKENNYTGVIGHFGTLNKAKANPLAQVGPLVQSPVQPGGNVLDRLSYLESENRSLRDVAEKLLAEAFERIANLELIIRG